MSCAKSYYRSLVEDKLLLIALEHVYRIFVLHLAAANMS